MSNKDKIYEIEKDIKIILTNHLPHIQIILTEHSQALRFIFWLLALVGGAIVINLIGTFF